MSRLTKYEPREYSMFPYQLKDDELSTKLDSIHKLGKLENLEDELGCPLEVVFKSIEDGIVIIGDIDKYGAMTLWLDKKPLIALVGEKRDFEEPRLIKYNEWCFSCESGSYSGCVALKDYQKTWWLKGDRVND